jgi:beta-lactamase superfamily II metal-dependent hydrolase
MEKLMGTRIHFLNVKDGDCSIIERPQSGRHTVIDVCCGNIGDEFSEEGILLESDFSRMEKPRGNFNQKANPTNPIDYMRSIGIDYIHRFILTHPDMDHMDGLKNLFSRISVTNFWDTGVKREAPDFSQGRYNEKDWKFYQQLINNRISNVKVISPKAGDKGKFWSYDDEDGNGAGDYLSIISPTNDLVEKCSFGNFNDASYVIVYRSSAGSIIFAGDSEDGAWENILKDHKSLVENAAVLFAPHHGRDSDRDWEFLDIVNPRVSFLGNAKSKNLGYAAWLKRDLPHFTNNQCGNVRLNFADKKVIVTIENHEYAYKYTEGHTCEIDGYWFLTEC